MVMSDKNLIRDPQWTGKAVFRCGATDDDHDSLFADIKLGPFHLQVELPIPFDGDGETETVALWTDMYHLGEREPIKMTAQYKRRKIPAKTLGKNMVNDDEDWSEVMTAYIKLQYFKLTVIVPIPKEERDGEEVPAYWKHAIIVHATDRNRNDRSTCHDVKTD